MGVTFTLRPSFSHCWRSLLAALDSSPSKLNSRFPQDADDREDRCTHECDEMDSERAKEVLLRLQG